MGIVNFYFGVRIASNKNKNVYPEIRLIILPIGSNIGLSKVVKIFLDML